MSKEDMWPEQQPIKRITRLQAQDRLVRKKLEAEYNRISLAVSKLSNQDLQNQLNDGLGYGEYRVEGEV